MREGEGPWVSEGGRGTMGESNKQTRVKSVVL